MQIAGFSTIQYPALNGVSTPSGGLNTKTTFNNAAPAVSSALAAFSLSQQMVDVSVQAQQTQFGYRRDGSLALHVNSNYSFALHSRESEVHLTFTAEQLGLNWASFAVNTSQPVELNLEYFLESAQIEQRLESRTIKPIRAPEEILEDIGSALREVLQGKGDKSIRLILDEEAVQSLMGDPKVRSLMNDLAALICLVNSLALHGGPRDGYTIQISGKGNPYQQVSEQTSVQAETQRLRMKIVILPPARHEEPGPVATGGEQ